MNLRSVHLNTRKPTAKVMREIIRHVRFSINPGILAYMAMSLKYVTKWYIGLNASATCIQSGRSVTG